MVKLANFPSYLISIGAVVKSPFDSVQPMDLPHFATKIKVFTSFTQDLVQFANKRF